MINKKYLGKKNINFNLDINSKPIYILHNGLKIFLIKNNNKLLNIELKINHPVIYNKYIYIIKILFDNLIKIGNNKINNKKINKILIKNLAKLNFNFGGFKLNIFKKNIENIFSLIKKIFIKAVFNNKKQFIKLLKKTILYNKIYNNNPELIINNLKNKFFYKNNFPHNLCFLKKDIYTLRLKNIKKIFKKYFIPNNSYLFFSGNISKQKTIYLVNKYFSKWKYKIFKKKKKRIININNNKINFINYSLLKNYIILKSGNIIKYILSDKIYITLLLINEILNDYKKKIIKKKDNKIIKKININLYISQYTSNIDITIFSINKNINQILILIKKIFNYLSIKKINNKYLNYKKKQFISNFLLKYENCYEKFNLIYNNYILNLKNKFCNKILKIINKITIKDIYLVSKNLLPQKYFKNVIIGNINFFNKENFIKKNIKINVYDIYGYKIN